MTARTTSGRNRHDFSRAPGSGDPEGIDAFRAVGFEHVGIGSRLGEEIPTTPHARLVCVHLQALPFLVALFTLTAIAMVIVTLMVLTVNEKSLLGRKKSGALHKRQPPDHSRSNLVTSAGSEIGAGVFTADTLPEEKAAELRAIEVHIE